MVLPRTKYTAAIAAINEMVKETRAAITRSRERMPAKRQPITESPEAKTAEPIAMSSDFFMEGK